MKNLKTTILTIAFVTSSIFTLSANSAEVNEYNSNEIMLSETEISTEFDLSKYFAIYRRTEYPDGSSVTEWFVFE